MSLLVEFCVVYIWRAIVRNKPIRQKSDKRRRRPRIFHVHRIYIYIRRNRYSFYMDILLYCFCFIHDIQAVLLGSLSQHNSILWILIALDRYIFATRRRCYLKLASSKVLYIHHRQIYNERQQQTEGGINFQMPRVIVRIDPFSRLSCCCVYT